MNFSNLSSSSLFNVEGYVAVVTGVALGSLGYWVARGLMQNGATVYCMDKDGKSLKEAICILNALPGTRVHASPFVGDVSSKEDVQNFVNMVMEREQSVDLVVNCAGDTAGEASKPFRAPLQDLQSAMWSSSLEEWEAKLLTNTWGPFLVSAGFLHLLGKAAKKGNGRGSVIIVSSVAARIWNPHMSIFGYTTSKIAVEQLARVLAAKLFPYGIRVNVLAPGSFPSKGANPPDNEYATSHPANKDNLPLRRSGTAEELVGPVIFLASRAGGYITGATFDVDGGLLLIANGTNKIAK